MLTVIPIAEELTFRLGLGAWFRQHFGLWLGSYFSALLFAIVHSDSSLLGWLSGNTGVPLGPLFLGLCNELLYHYSGSIVAIVCLHSAANATPLVFSYLDQRWLEWLEVLYLS